MPRSPVAPAKNPSPVGFWRCTRSRYSDFIVGQFYACVQIGPSFDDSGEIIPVHQREHRIFPKIEKDGWSASWSDEDGRFSIRRSQLDFEFAEPMGTIAYQEILDVVAPGQARHMRAVDFPQTRAAQRAAVAQERRGRSSPFSPAQIGCAAALGLAMTTLTVLML